MNAGNIYSFIAAGAVLGGVQAMAADFTNAPRDPYFQSSGSWGQNYDDQWAIKAIGLSAGPDSAWRMVGENPNPVVVAVIDTGLDWNHADISADAIWTNPRETPGNNVDDDGNGFVDDVIGWNFYADNNKPWDHDGHGTFVSGVIAAEWNDRGIAGINPAAKIMVLKALNNFGHSRASYLARALIYAADNGADIVNMSVGGEGLTAAEREAVAYASSKGVLIIAAAGNEARNLEGYGIASISGVVTVASTDQEGARAVFSNWGAGVDLAAPGVEVLGLRARRTDLLRGILDVDYADGDAYVGADKRYYRVSGTSFSAPIVAGVASLIKARNPNYSAAEIERILINSARDVGAAGHDNYTGAGVVDARAALSATPDFFITAAISDMRVAFLQGKQVAEIIGSVDADKLHDAVIEIGAGETPQSWKEVGMIQRPVSEDVIYAIPAGAFSGSQVWIIRVTVRHENGESRVAQFRLELG